MNDETVYSGPTCEPCSGTLYKKVKLGALDWMRCTECKNMTKIEDSDNLTPLDPQPE